jgi:hypothetical protein
VDILHEWSSMLALALAVAAVAMTVGRSNVFAPLRTFVDDRSRWFGELVSCPYCVSHWLAFAAVAVYRPRIVDSGVVLADYAVAAFALVSLATFACAIIVRAFRLVVPRGADATPGT